MQNNMQNNMQGNMQGNFNTQDTGKGLCIASLVLGIVATVLAWFYAINTIALICGIVGIICASSGRKKALEANSPTGIGTAGLVLSIIGTVLAGIGFVTCTLCVTCAASSGAISYH